ncbi:hypothetical protein LJC68_10030 [Bacteroidales bacterium OttesenSCG-928-B11]|nr:hypothetical protein [Bacteroidales bacterium OttesenSCG-928-E04]MDL2313198.1 hypothetical protein [Bacteroidales bacterium OttesenSCG-928-B11]MDL2326908.1 hypothetical protein [Bacteroidales bacterium OttesenSCG-928-A14]
MKKTICLVLFALVINFASAQKTAEIIALEKSNLKPIESVANGFGEKVDKESQVIRINRKENFKSEAKERNEMVLSYLQSKRDMYGLSNDLNDIEITDTRKTPSGTYVYCKQYIHGIPVFASNFIVYLDKENVVRYALNEFRNMGIYERIYADPSIEGAEALKIAQEYLNIENDTECKSKTELVYFESIDKGLELAWKINVTPIESLGSWQIFVSANTGNVIHAESTNRHINGVGKVYNPNPLVSAGVPYGHGDCYSHNDGLTNPCLNGELEEVILQGISYEKGLYKLKGQYCVIEDFLSPYGHNIPQLPAPIFNYTREDEEFAAVMAYYHIDLSARRVLELGYEIPDRIKGLRVDPHVASNDAYYEQDDNYIALGSSIEFDNIFVNAGEDADVIWHEHAHTFQENFNPFFMLYAEETRSVQEGSSDYWAAI